MGSSSSTVYYWCFIIIRVGKTATELWSTGIKFMSPGFQLEMQQYDFCSIPYCSAVLYVTDLARQTRPFLKSKLRTRQNTDACSWSRYGSQLAARYWPYSCTLIGLVSKGWFPRYWASGEQEAVLEYYYSLPQYGPTRYPLLLVAR